MEVDLGFAHACMDVFNGINELERESMRAAIVANKRVHRVPPLNDMVYTNRVGELWYFDVDGNLSHTLGFLKGVKHGCVLGVFIFCVAMAPVYVIIRLKLGPDGLLVALSDDVYLHGPQVNVAQAIYAALALYGKVGLKM